MKNNNEIMKTKLGAITNRLSELLKPEKHIYYDAQEILSSYETFARIHDALTKEHSDLFGDFIRMEKPSQTTDSDGRGYVGRQELESLNRDVKYILDIIEHANSYTNAKEPLTGIKNTEMWTLIQENYDVTKQQFGKKMNFVKDEFKRKIIFRDVADASYLLKLGFYKPAVILAGGVIEELLRIYLTNKGVSVKDKRFVDYIDLCKEQGFLKKSIHRLGDVVRCFRNIVHLGTEKRREDSILKSTATMAVSAIFTIANDFYQK